MKTLSDKIIEVDNQPDNGFFWEEDVREFIRKLKEWIDKQHIHEFGTKGQDCSHSCWGKMIPKFIDELAGEKLVNSPVGKGVAYSEKSETRSTGLSKNSEAEK